MGQNTLSLTGEIKMMKTYSLLRLILILPSIILITFELYAQESFFLPKIGCQFLIPKGYQKSEKTTHDLMESYRMLLYPDSISEEEKKRRARLEAVFHKELDELLQLPKRPFFTLQVRDIGRNISKNDIEVQINAFRKIKNNPIEVFEDVTVDNMLEYLITKELIINKSNNSIIMMHQTKSIWEEDDEYVIQFFTFYRTGLMIFNFYSDIQELRKNIRDFYEVINSFRLSEKKKVDLIH